MSEAMTEANKEELKLCPCCKVSPISPKSPIGKCEPCSAEEVKGWCPGCFNSLCQCRTPSGQVEGLLKQIWEYVDYNAGDDRFATELKAFLVGISESSTALAVPPTGEPKEKT